MAFTFTLDEIETQESPSGRLGSSAAPSSVRPAAPRPAPDRVSAPRLIEFTLDDINQPASVGPITFSPGDIDRQVEAGNVDLARQPRVPNPDGGTSTVYSSSFNIDGVEVLLPAVTPDGRLLRSDDEIVGEYERTGRHLGKFSTPEAATTFAEQLHNDYAAGTYDEPREPDFRVEVVGELPRETSIGDRLRDLGISALKGAISVPEAAVGLADLVSGGRAGQVLEDYLAFKPQEAKAILDTYYSEGQQAAFARVAEVEGLVQKAVAALSHPSVLAQSVVESAPLMLGGAGVARGVLAAAPRVGALAAGAAGEGAVSAGSAAESIRHASADRRLTPEQSALAATSGALTGALGVIGGKAARALGIADVETLLAGAAVDRAARKGLARQIVEGAVQEGVLEELPQSVQEQVLQNRATGRDLLEGVDDAVVMGALAGAVMGAGAQVPGAVRGGRGVRAADTGTPSPTGRLVTPDVLAAPAAAEPAQTDGRVPFTVDEIEAIEPTAPPIDPRDPPILPSAVPAPAPAAADPFATLGPVPAERPGTFTPEVQHEEMVRLASDPAIVEGAKTMEARAREAGMSNDARRQRAQARVERQAATPAPIAPITFTADEIEAVDEAAPAPREYASTQVDLPPDVGAQVRELGARIPDEDLAADGREDEPHVTVQYGIENEDIDALRAALADQGPIAVTFGKTSLFENDDADVVKVDIESDDLRRVRQTIADTLDAPGDTHPEYIPHATVAYVKPGKGKAYAGDASLEGQTATIDRLTFSTKDRQRIEFPLTGQTPASVPHGTSTTVASRSVDASPAVQRGAVSREHAFLLRWLADDMTEMPFQAASRMRGVAAVDETTRAPNQEEARQRLYTPRVAGTPTREMFEAMGVSASRAEIAQQIDRFLAGGAKTPGKAAQAALRLAPVFEEAWDGQRFDFTRVSDETLTAAGVSRSALRSPLTLPREGQPADVMARYFPDMAGPDAPPDTVRQHAMRQVADPTRLDDLVADYNARKDFGNIVSTDHAKELFRAYQEHPTRFNEAVADAANRVALEVYHERLKAEPGFPGEAVITSGGPGSGKTTLTAHSEDAQSADVVFDSVGSNLDATRQRIEEALASGRTVTRIVVYRDPEDAWVAGAITRAKKTGRPVTIEGHVLGHKRALENAVTLSDEYADDVRVRLVVYDNTEEAGRPVPEHERVGFLRTRAEAYNEADVRTAIHDLTDRARAAGATSDDLYAALTSTRRVAQEAGGVGRRRADEGRARGEARPGGPSNAPDLGREPGRTSDAPPVTQPPTGAPGSSRRRATRRPFDPQKGDDAHTVKTASGILRRITSTPRTLRQIAQAVHDYEWRAKGRKDDGDALLATREQIARLVKRGYVSRYWDRQGEVFYVTAETLKPENLYTSEEMDAFEAADTAAAEAPKADMLDTGEQQTRLPGDVGAVREQEQATPEFDAPFTLTSEVSQAPPALQRDLLTEMHGPARTDEDMEPFRAAARVFNEAREDYRAGRISDAEYVAASKAFEQAQADDEARVRAPQPTPKITARRREQEPTRKRTTASRAKRLPPGTVVVAEGPHTPRPYLRQATPAERAVIFQPGNVVAGYGGLDTVVAYNELPDGSWSVRVRGEDGRERGHTTNPQVVKESVRDRVRGDQMRQFTAPTTKTPPGGHGSDLPEGATLPVKTGTVPKAPRSLFAPTADEALHPASPPALDAIRALELPEVVAFARAFGGVVPTVVKQFRKEGKQGDFHPVTGRVRIHADLFKRGSEVELAKVIAHEIGHWLDWFPGRTLKRGNVLGHLLSLRNFLKHTFTAPSGETIHRDDVRKELLALSELWRGPISGSPTYVQYRKRSTELYADATSVLLNNPGLLEQKAPIFYRQFFDHLDRKPEVRRAYFALQELLSGTHEELVERRRAGVREMFHEGDAKAVDIETLRQEEQKAASRNLGTRLRIELVDKNTPVIDRVRAMEARGQRLNPDDDPRFALKEVRYLGALQQGFLERTFQPVYDSLARAGVDWTTFGEVLFYERIASGDRTDVANPRGIAPSHAQELLDDLRNSLSDDQRAALNRGLTQFRAAVQEVTKQAYEAGLIKPELYAEIAKNPAYATFRVLDYLEKNLSSAIRHQVGTLKDVQNPADATILKTLVTLRAIEYQTMKQKVFAALEQHDPREIEDAKQRFSGTGMEFVEPEKPDQQGLVTYYEHGKRRGKYVPRQVADAIENVSIGQNLATLEAVRFANRGWFRPVFTSMNLGFQASNFIRDFWRYWTNIPKATLVSALTRYLEAVPAARARAYGLRANPSERMRQAADDLQQMREARILSTTFNDFAKGRTIEDTQIEEIFAQHGLKEQPPPPSGPLRTLLRGVVDWIEQTGNFIETLPKAAAVYEYRGNGSISDIPADVRAHIREKVGSPDFLISGTLKPITNELFLFSNAITQAVRSDIAVATDPTTRASFWWKNAAAFGVPVMLTVAVELFGHHLGSDDEEDASADGELTGWRYVQRILQGATEYDKTNYTIIPIGLDEKGNSIYWRIPRSDTGRLMAGLLRKALLASTGDADIMASLQSVFSYIAGQAPGLTPSLGLVTDVVEFTSGQQVYDEFRGRGVFTNDELKAGGWDKLKKFIGFEFQQMGGGVIWKFFPGDRPPETQTRAQKILEYPGVSNLAGRFIRITNYGHMERLRAARAGVEQTEARTRIRERQAVNEALKGYQRLAPPQQTPREQERLARDIVQQLYPDARPDTRKAELRDVLRKIRMGAVRGEADPVVDAVMGATSNAQKAAVILRARRDMGPPAFATWYSRAQREGVISENLQKVVRDHIRSEGAQ